MKKILMILMSTMMMLSCGRSKESDKDVLVVSIEPQRYLLEQIVGDKMDVVSIVGKGADPESFDPSVSTLGLLERSKVFFTIGSGAFEANLIARLKESGADIRTVDCRNGITMIAGGAHAGGDCTHNHEHEYDPHVWTSPANMRVVAKNMYDALVEMEGGGCHKERYDSLIARIDAVAEQMDSILRPMKGTSFLVWHPSLSYLARDYDLNQIAIGAENKELSAAAFKQKIDEARQHGSAVFFIQPDSDAGRSESVAKQTGSRMVEINPLSYDWSGEMIKIATAVAQTK